MMNGAVTFGTLDGANVEISEAVGKDNIFIFGLRADQTLEYYISRSYKAWDEYNKSPRLKRVIDQLVDGTFGHGGQFQGIHDHLLRDNDEFFVLRDFCSCIDASAKLTSLYVDRQNWLSTCLVNIAKSGVFSSDRTIRQYADEIWHVPYEAITLRR